MHFSDAQRKFFFAIMVVKSLDLIGKITFDTQNYF